MAIQSIQNRCSNAWDYVSNNPGKCVAGSVAAISLTPALYHVVPWAVGGIVSGGSSTAGAVSNIAKDLIGGEPLTIVNFGYLGLTLVVIVSNLTSKNVKAKSDEEVKWGYFEKAVALFAGWLVINGLTIKAFYSESGQPLSH